jgi:hypothetical protein
MQLQIYGPLPIDALQHAHLLNSLICQREGLSCV